MKFFQLLFSYLLTLSVCSAEVQKIIVYRSQHEMEMEEYSRQHPEIYLWILGIMSVSVVLMIAYNFWKNRKSKNYFRNRY